MSAHPWSLVAPWYRRQRHADLEPSATPPAIQQYDTSRLIDVFLANPQRSLKLDVAAGDVARLFLAVQRRFYLVVCELHCDRLGFPDARADDVCQAGFVVRRRRVPAAAEVEREHAQVASRVAARTEQIDGLQAPGALAVAQVRRLAARRAADARRLASLERELERVAAGGPREPAVEGWSPAERDGAGSWSRIDADAPSDGDEQVHPLYALIADPRLASHAARGRSLFFGVVPTATAARDAAGAPQLDATSRYELRCFVRRHDPRCPRTLGLGRDCRGEVTWSAPSQLFELASAQGAAVPPPVAEAELPAAALAGAA